MTEPQEAHPVAEAIRQMLDDALPAAATVHLGGVPSGATTPYVVLYPDIGTESTADRTLDDGVPTDFRFQATSVGATFTQAILTAGMANTVLLTTTPTVAGSRVRPIRQEGSQPVRRDDESSPLWFGTAQYVARSERL
ncbi:hypothetical protein [Nonomuraea sp. NPDC049141]|uniref:hypothetical protein n=1 Tax=Nonomuraea sp. NPDC049141 TaxID=3155500 RepID=UPI00340FAE3C